MARTLTEAARRLKRPGILLTDDVRLPDPTPVLRALPKGGIVILRRRDTQARRTLVHTLRNPVRAHGLKLVVAADIPLALSIRADGVHVPEFQAKQMTLTRLRLWRAAHPNRIISTSAHTPRAIASARWADLILISPIFETASHPKQKPLGALTYRLWTRNISHGVTPLGGISLETFKRLRGSKIAAIAAISGWLA